MSLVRLLTGLLATTTTSLDGVSRVKYAGRMAPIPTLAVCDGVFVIDVDFSTHDDLKLGRCVTGTHRVSVLAASSTDAQLAACTMIACHAMPTASRVVGASF